MFRKALLPVLALAALSGCATDYTYRNGSGDYYYGRPQVEYRHIGGYGYGGYGYGTGGYGGNGAYGYGGPTYYYDRFGRLVYGDPYGGYGSPYLRPYVRYQTRPQVYHHHHQHPATNPGTPNNENVDGPRPGNDRRPPWRNFGGMRSGAPLGQVDVDGEERPRRPMAPAAPMARSDGMRMPSRGSDDGERMGPMSGGGSGVRGARVRTSPTPEEE
ncbi:MAG: hypothetical protein V4704_04710 [Pseudomonadota bacterium]